MLLDFVTQFATQCIETTGLAGAGFLMALESMIAPVPSEAVMPFVGMLVFQGKFQWLPAILATSAGSLLGSLASYGIGNWGGQPLVLKIGRYLMLNESHLNWTNRWFEKHGSKTIFISRFIPIVRHLISIPAGIGRMPLGPFCLHTVLGATLWNVFLMYLGFKLQSHWKEVQHYSHLIDAILIPLAVVAAVGWYLLHRKKTHV